VALYKFSGGRVSKSFSVSGLVVLLGLVGCGGGDSPEEKCENFLSTVCDRGLECAPAETPSHASCVDALESVVPCGMVESVGDSFDSCMDKVESNSCATLFPRDSQGEVALVLPADCNGVLEGPESFGGDVRISARSSAFYGPISGAAQ
jgi:hypothetical protein